MANRIDVMISSTARDLPDHRKAASEACMGLGLFPEMMEHLPALASDAIDASLKMVEESQVYLGILARRYGYVPDDPRNPEQISITEMEYRRAVELGKPRLMFLAAEPHQPALEQEPGPGAAKLAAFIDRVQKENVVKFFHSADELRAHVTQALAHWLDLRVTWMPAALPPAGILPEPRLFPPGSRVPLNRNPNFVGRERDLLWLADRLLHRPAGDGLKIVITPAVASFGTGGIGKTQLALEFALRYGQYFYGVHWVNLLVPEGARLDTQFSAEVAACGLAMGLDDFPEEQPEQVQAALQHWQKSRPRLVILDNVDSPAQIEDILPQLAGLCVLITSRWGESQDWLNAGVEPGGLQVLSREQSVLLLRRLAPHLRQLPDAEVAALAERLGDYPLALDLAGRYLHAMRRVGLKLSDYCQQLDGSAVAHSSFSDWAARANQANPTRHDTNIAATFGLSWSKVSDPLARRLFRSCGYLAPNSPIPPELLQRLAAEDEAAGPDLEALANALNQLVQYGLLTTAAEDDSHLVIHPLLADFARVLDASLEDGPRQLERVGIALENLGVQALTTRLPEKFTPLRAHLEAAASKVVDAGIVITGNLSIDNPEIREESSGVLWAHLGYHYQDVGDYYAAQRYYNQAMVADERIFGATNSAKGHWLDNIGTTYIELGDPSTAIEKFCCSRDIFESVYGHDHPFVATELNNIGYVHYRLKEYSEARTLTEQALQIDEKYYGPDYAGLAIELNNLGATHRNMGDFAAARKYIERALAIDEKVFGSDHPETGRRLLSLGHLHKDMNNLQAAKQTYNQALAILEKSLGPDHPDTVQIYGFLASLYMTEGDIDSARENYKRALSILEPRLPTGHPNIQSLREKLAALDAPEAGHAAA